MSRFRASTRTAPAAAIVIALALFVAACGSSGDAEESSEPNLVSADDLAIDSESLAAAGADDDDAGADADNTAGGASEGDGESAGSTTTTLPQEEETLEDEFFDSVEEFMSCLEAEGFEFIGPPSGALGADAPQNAQPYVDALIACAARSGVQEKLAEVDAARAEMTPEEVEEENRAFLLFRDCMVGRGWLILDPTPDENGLLFHGVQSTSEWIAPDGQSLATSDDTAECQALVQEEQGE